MTSASPSSALDVAARYDAFAAEHDINEYYTRANPVIRYIENSRLRIIARMVQAGPDDRILEVGCGGGHVLRLFPHSCLTGVDVSDCMLNKARENLRGYRVRWLKGELHTLGIPDCSFDRIICTEVLEHVVDPHTILCEMKRLLAPNGRIVVTLPNDHLIHRLKSLVHKSGMARLPRCGRTGWGGDDYHLHIWRIAEMRELLSAYYRITRECFAPGRWLPIRCCFQCAVA